MIGEILDSAKEEIKRRLSSSIYGTYIFFWLLLHHRFIFAIFFANEDRIWQSTGQLKSDYLGQVFFNTHSFWSVVWWVAPAALTWLFIWHFPRYVYLPLFKKELAYDTEKKQFQIEQQRILESEATKLEKESVKKLDVVAEKAKKEKKIQEIDPTLAWAEEFKDFQKTPYFLDFKLLIESVYRENGNVAWYRDGEARETHIPQGILAYSHTNNLLEFTRNHEGVELTQKGKYFVRQYSVQVKI